MMIPVDSEATAAYVAHAIYKLSRPADAVGDFTLYAFDWRQDAAGGWWMNWPEDMAVYINPERGTDTMLALKQFVDMGRLSPESAFNALLEVQTNVGEAIPLGSITPAEWAAVARNAADITWPAPEMP